MRQEKRFPLSPEYFTDFRFHQLRIYAEGLVGLIAAVFLLKRKLKPSLSNG